MRKIPCKICPECGRVNKVDALTCLCGVNISNVRGELRDSESLDAKELESLIYDGVIYKQICRVCSLEYITNEAMQPILQCSSCGGRMTGREEYIEEVEKPEALCKDEETKKEQIKLTVGSMENEEIGGYAPSEDMDEEEDDTENPFAMMLSGITKQIDAVKPKSTLSKNMEKSFDDEDEIDWSDDIKEYGTHKEEKESTRKQELVFTCTTNKSITYRVEAFEGQEYRIGRDYNMAESLVSDERISYDHCHLTYQNGIWRVVDHSTNGTFVNRKDIGENGICTLRDGDSLTLGHFSDSITFKVTIR